MSVTIRLARIGKRNAPSFKIVVSNTRDKRNGRYLEVLGYYNPTKVPNEFKINEERYDYWRSVGAMVTDAVTALRDGTYEFKPYNPDAEKNNEEKSSEPESENTTKEEPVKDKKSEEESTE